MEQSPSIQDTIHLTRQASLIPIEALNVPITVIGCGAIGSFTTLSLAKMGFEDIEVWDADVVSVENMNSQFFRFRDIDKSKTMALKEIVQDFTKVKIRTKTRFYEEGILDGIVIVAVDSMSARKTVWENHAGKSTSTIAIIDPRMGAEEAQLHVVIPMDPTDQKVYPKSLYTDEDAVQEACTAKATVYTATMLSGLVCKAVKDIITTKKPSFRKALWSIKNNDLIFHNGKTEKPTFFQMKSDIADYINDPVEFRPTDIPDATMGTSASVGSTVFIDSVALHRQMMDEWAQTMVQRGGT